MYRQHLVIFCNDKTEALTAAASLPPFKDMPRFFVLNCDKPSPAEMSWLRPIDDYLTLGKVNELGNSAEIGIRAGILYIIGWWHLFFCHANNLPTTDDLLEIRKKLDENKGFLQMDKIWGISKEHVLLFGLSKVLGSGIAQVEENNLSYELELLKALKGEPVNKDVFTAAFLENVPLRGMEIQGELDNINQEAKDFVNHMVKEYPKITDQAGVIFISSDISESGLKHMLSNIDNQTMVAIVSNSEIKYDIEDILSLNCNDDFLLKLYLKNKKEG